MNTEPEIIVVVDDPQYQQFFLDSLQMRCNISFCASVSVASDLIDLIHPDILIVDLDLRGGIGLSVIAELRHNSASKEAFCIVVSSSTEKLDYTNAIAAGANTLLIKPFSEDQLTSVIESYISQTSNFK